jgi:hypothetical protein
MCTCMFVHARDGFPFSARARICRTERFCPVLDFLVALREASFCGFGDGKVEGPFGLSYRRPRLVFRGGTFCEPPPIVGSWCP